MDLYRLLALSENPQGCQGRNRLHVDALLNCAYPSITAKELRFEDYAKREPKMFFSRAELNEYFRPRVNELLGCRCDDCTEARREGNDEMSLSDKKRRVQSHPWILGLMIYLGKLHYIYYWIKWDYFDYKGELKPGIMDDGRVKKELINPDFDRSIFHEAYLRAVSMFSPMTFEIKDNETCPYWEPPESCRFPYSNEQSISTKGFYGILTKVEILPEHLDQNMKDIMRRYPTSGTNAGGDRKSMERNVLAMVSKIGRPASDNMITLLFSYKWKEQIHFLFPFIEINLEQVLRQNKCPRDHSSKLGPDEQLPEHWLWSELKGVCYALSVFHNMMKSPFEDNKAIVIGLHFDLKPANILVTTDGKLKVTDFGQSIIQIHGNGEDMTVPHNPGDSRYAAPESRPTLDYMKDGPEDIQVLLNYDVWSLGCIMVEVLIHMLDLKTLEGFDLELAKEGNTGFFTGTHLKQCVISSLQDFQAKFNNTPQVHYMTAVTELIHRMLSHDIKERPYSLEVFDELQRAEDDLADPSKQQDRITPEVKAYNLTDGMGFKELGWPNGHSIVSFADNAMGIVRNQELAGSDSSEELQDRNKHLSRSLWFGELIEEEELMCSREEVVELSRWCFSPTYLFRGQTNGNGRFECRLFPIMELQGQRKSYDLAFIFEFESLEDALLFQGTLLKKTIFPPIRGTVESMISKKPGRWSREQRQPPELNHQPVHIQLWAEDKPKHYKPVVLSLIGPTSTAVSDSSSTAPTTPVERPNIDKSKIMVIFLEGLGPLKDVVNNGYRVFKAGSNPEGKQFVNIVNDSALNHQSYVVRQLPVQPAWENQDLNETLHASSSILLEVGYQKPPEADDEGSFKVKDMKLVLETRDGEI
ncbi:unnamed protein product [Fusarium equiseti]|uniref:Protein kinase domain-containing protein n=1 Tax=Fusarium equiseti TaxID=61235 RepID=A0A8J2NJN8_FUSEQ|nr:unnamed protein product [Fusarium equiseti]